MSAKTKKMLDNNHAAESRLGLPDILEKTAKVLARVRKGAKLVSIEPELVFGFRLGLPVDHGDYEALGIRQPRRPAYYEGASCLRRVAEIRRARKFGDPIKCGVVNVAGKDRIVVVNGSTRLYAAALEAVEDSTAFAEVEALIDHEATVSELYAEAVAANMEGRNEPLTPLEMGEAIQAFIDEGWSKLEICARLGKPSHWLKDLDGYLALLTSPDEVKEATSREESPVAPSVATELAMLPHETQRELVKDGARPTLKDVRGARSRHRAAARDAAAPDQPAPRQRKMRLIPSRKVAAFALFLGEELEVWLQEREARRGLFSTRNSLIERLEAFAEDLEALEET